MPRLSGFGGRRLARRGDGRVRAAGPVSSPGVEGRRRAADPLAGPPPPAVERRLTAASLPVSMAAERRVTEGQADALAGAFEALSRQIAGLRFWRQVHTTLLFLILARIAAPYVGALFGVEVPR